MAKVAMALQALLVLGALAAPAALAEDFKVGGSDGWSLNGDYAEWAKGKTFAVGDTLVFEYDSTHVVDVVNKAGYDNCDASGATEKFNNGNTRIKLEKPGPMYFICSTPGHCPPMKLAINVEDSSSPSGGGSPPSSSASPESPPGTGTGSGRTPPSDNEAAGKVVASFGALAASAVVLGLVVA